VRKLTRPLADDVAQLIENPQVELHRAQMTGAPPDVLHDDSHDALSAASVSWPLRLVSRVRWCRATKCDPTID
jgi:hypothetical protein